MSGKINSYDESGKIYVSTINNVWFSTKHHADLLNYDYPAGCVFVFSPLNHNEFLCAREYSQIQPVDFNTNPERLVAIITTPENITRVSNWLKSGKINSPSAQVLTFADTPAALMTPESEL